jgi:hypothetical protein
MTPLNDVAKIDKDSEIISERIDMVPVPVLEYCKYTGTVIGKTSRTGNWTALKFYALVSPEPLQKESFIITRHRRRNSTGARVSLQEDKSGSKTRGGPHKGLALATQST